MKKVAILQSNYIPWKGYFDIIGLVDEFILYDDMQYTRRDWRNRNQIKTANGPQWLTIPVDTKGKFTQRICDTRVSDPRWAGEHWKAIRFAYAKAPYFKTYEPLLAGLYEKAAGMELLSEVNYLFLTELCRVLGIGTKITWSMDYTLVPGKTERLAQLVLDAGGGYYLSGPAAKDYIDESVFRNAGVELAWMDYDGYPTYPQLHGEFTHHVSVLDLLFMTGPDAKRYMKWGGENP